MTAMLMDIPTQKIRSIFRWVLDFFNSIIESLPEDLKHMVNQASKVLQIEQPNKSRKKRNKNVKSKISRNKIVSHAISEAIKNNTTNVLIRLTHMYKRIAFEAFIFIFEDYIEDIIFHIFWEFAFPSNDGDVYYLIEMMRLVH